MPRFARLRATEIRDVRPGLQRMTLTDGSEAYALTEICGPVSPGDELLVNVSALELGLGTGGAHVVHTNLSAPPEAGESVGSGSGRVMKARYLAEQIPVHAVEEASAGPNAEASGVPVLPSLVGTRAVLCVLHSHAMALAAAVHDATDHAPGYVMTDGGALPFILSDLAAACLEQGAIATAVSTGQAFGAPIEAVTVASGVAAMADHGINRVVIAPGPGHLGTASPLGFSGLDLVGHAAVLNGLGAATALAVRASSADQRARHRGISHHAHAMATLGPTQTVVPVPSRRGTLASAASGDSDEHSAWIESLGEKAIVLHPLDLTGALERCGLSVTTMGRPLERDPLACDWIGAAAAWLAKE